jgi:calcium-dependent protein kinase
MKSGSFAQYYDFGTLLGQGAYGKVWKVVHKTTRIELAVTTEIVRAMKQIRKAALFEEE